MSFILRKTEKKPNKPERLYLKYNSLIHQTSFAILQDKELAEDAVQESFEKIIRNLHRIDENNEARTLSFLSIIGRNTAIDIARRHGRINSAEYNEDPSAYIDIAAADPLDIVIKQETLKEVTEALESLDPIYRDVFILRHLHDMSRAEIADILGIQEETVKKRLYRAKKKIIEILKEKEVMP